ncbi:hypothetical protein [Pedobacter soli]|nr:hypothetical protein [Pedobacter soli]
MKYIKLLPVVGMLILVIAYFNERKFSRLLACDRLNGFKVESYSGTVA